MIVETSQGLHSMDWLCLLTFIIFLFVFGLLIFEIVPRMYLAMFGAVILVVVGVFDWHEAMTYVSWETIGFLLGMLLLTEILVEAGFFRWIAMVLARAVHYDPVKILIFFPLLSFFLSAILSSITVMVFLSVITFELSKILKFDPVPVIISEVILANIGGAATLVGDPPNVILGTVLGFGFNDFLVHNGPIAILAGIGALAVTFWMNRRNFVRVYSHKEIVRLEHMHPSANLKDKHLLAAGLLGMTLTLLLLITRPYLNKMGIPMDVATASLFPAFIILTFGGKKIYKHNFIRKIDAETLMFFIGLFILIGALEKKHIIQLVVNTLASSFTTAWSFISSIFWGSALISGFVDNVPLAMTMTSIIKESVVEGIVPSIGIMVWAVSLGVDLGGNLTPIGASANVVAYAYLEKSGIKMNWLRWVKLALFPSLVALLISYIGVFLKFHFKFW